MRRFFLKAADVLNDDHPVLAKKLRHMSPHWMGHSHASMHSRTAPISQAYATTLMYLRGDYRACRITEAFSSRNTNWQAD